jgi:high mobility group protein B1
MNFIDIAKELGNRWAHLENDKKAPFNEIAEKDKKRYLSEMQNYEAPEGTSKPVKKLARRKKDKDAPKRNMSSYMLFANDHRQGIMDANPNIRFADLGRLMGEAWAKASPEVKEQYEEKARQDKARYESQMLSYKENIKQSVLHCNAFDEMEDASKIGAVMQEILQEVSDVEPTSEEINAS